MATFSNNLETKTSKSSCIEFICQQCDYKCCKKFNWDRHVLTSKHLKSTNINKIATKTEQNEQKKETYMCHTCDKQYKDRTGLWRHKKSCNFENEQNNDVKIDNELSDKNLIIMLMKKNDELQSMMMEVIKNGTNNTTNNTTNSHNKAFNLNFFLNETCKDAMNIMDFVDSIKLQLSDLERVGELGYVEGISKIIVKNLKELDVTQRPVHCTDQKRETMYIKDDDKWEKDEEKQTLL
jgi:hypothetical protein